MTEEASTHFHVDVRVQLALGHGVVRLFAKFEKSYHCVGVVLEKATEQSRQAD